VWPVAVMREFCPLLKAAAAWPIVVIDCGFSLTLSQSKNTMNDGDGAGGGGGGAAAGCGCSHAARATAAAARTNNFLSMALSPLK